MLKGKKILVTAGGTQEYIDDVRVLTNISTGKLGCRISETLTTNGADVFYVCGKNSVLPFSAHIQEVRTAQVAMNVMKKIIIDEKIDAVVHSMAVSDFTFKRDKAVKLKSNDPEAFIEFLRQNITMNPKIISQIKIWRPETILVGFKFEVGTTEEDLLHLAQESIEKNGCDLIVANDKAEMTRQQEHVACLIPSTRMIQKIGYHEDCSDGHTPAAQYHWHVRGKEEIASAICTFLRDVLS